MNKLYLFIITMIIPLATACTLRPVTGQGTVAPAGAEVAAQPSIADFPPRPAAQVVLGTSEVYYQAAVDDTTVSLSFTDAQGNIACQIPPRVFQRGESIYAAADAAFTGCPYRDGSMVASANQTIVVVSDSVITLALAGSAGIKRNIYPGISGDDVNTAFFVPDLYPNAAVAGASLYVQNAASGANSFEVVLRDQAGNSLITETYELAEYGVQRLTIDALLAEADRLENVPLTAHIRAEQNVAVSITGCRYNLCIANSTPSKSSNHWFVPGLVSGGQTADALNHYSTMTVVNVEAQAAAVTITYDAAAAPVSYTIPALGSLHLTTRDFPQSFAGNTAVEVQSAAQLVVTAQYLNFIDGQGAAYNGMASDQGGTELFLPRVMVSETVDAVLYLQNLSATPAEVTLSLYKQAGPDETAPAPTRVALPALAPFESRAVALKAYLPAAEQRSWAGAALLEGTGPISALNLTKSRAEPYWATGYNAIAVTAEDDPE